MAYLVAHDLFDRGAMDVYEMETLASAQARAKANQQTAEDEGYGDGIRWEAYETLPSFRIVAHHGKEESAAGCDVHTEGVFGCNACESAGRNRRG